MKALRCSSTVDRKPLVVVAHSLEASFEAALEALQEVGIPPPWPPLL